MTIRKDLVDELIRVTKKYYKTGDVDLLPSLQNAEKNLEKECKATFYVLTLIGNLAMFIQRRGVGTYEDIYKALAVFGVIVE